MNSTLEKNKSYCPAAFREIYVDSSGNYRLCCYHKTNSLFDFNDQKDLPFDYFMSQAMEKVRNDMFEGKKIKGCELCYDMEQRTGHSYRTNRYFKDFGFVEDVRNLTLKLRINGSYCNLGCYMCFPQNSSTRRNELKAVFGEEYKNMDNFGKEYEAVNHTQWEKMIDNIVANISLVAKIHMTGGEPLQLPKHWEFVDRIPQEHAKHITLSYDTNFTETKYKNHSVYDIVDKFKKVHIGISCDHYGDKLEWIRYPIDVQKFENNLRDCRDIIAHLNCTVSLLNVNDLFEIQDYYQNNFGLNVTFHNVARGPRFLSICNLPDTQKKMLKEKYKDLPYVIDELNRPSWGLLQQGLDYCQQLSDHRGFDYKKLWPNL